MSELISEKLKKDLRIKKAKSTLVEVYKEYQDEIKGIRPPQLHLKASFEETIHEFEELRGGKLWHPYLGSGIGKGAFVELLDGSIKYDFISGIGVHFAHGNSKIIEANLDACMQDIVMQGNLQQNGEIVELSKLLTKEAKMDHIFFTTSGAMACENALKIIFQKKFPRKRLLAFDRCFMGRTTTLSQVTDKASFREGLPTNIFVDYLPFFDPRHPKESSDLAISTLKKMIARYPKEHAALCVELIQGEAGYFCGNEAFFSSLFTIAKEAGIAVFIDEVQTFGRTSRLFAFQHFKLEPFVDVVTIGKISQICATLFKEEYKPGIGLLSQTFIGSTSAIFSCKVIVEMLLKEGFFGDDGKIVKFHAHFERLLNNFSERYPGVIEGPFGLGSMIAFTPFKGDKEKATKLAKALFEAGLITFIAGENPTRIRMLLPIGGITAHDIDQAFIILEKTILEVDGKNG